jgi:hypothetical protein
MGAKMYVERKNEGVSREPSILWALAVILHWRESHDIMTRLKSVGVMSTEDATLHSRGLPEAKHSRQDLNLWCVSQGWTRPRHHDLLKFYIAILDMENNRDSGPKDPPEQEINRIPQESRRSFLIPIEISCLDLTVIPAWNWHWMCEIWRQFHPKARIFI